MFSEQGSLSGKSTLNGIESTESIGFSDQSVRNWKGLKCRTLDKKFNWIIVSGEVTGV